MTITIGRASRSVPLLGSEAALAAAFLLDLITALVVLGYGNAYLLQRLEAPASSPALALTLYSAMKIASAPAIGRAVDRWPAPWFVAGAGVVSLAALVLIAASESVAGYMAGVSVLGASTPAIWILVYRAVASSGSNGRGARSAVQLSVVSAAGTTAGFGLALLAAQAQVDEAPFLGAAVCVAAGTLLLLRSSGRVGSVMRTASITEPGVAARRDETAASAGLAARGVVFGHFFIVGGLLVVAWPFVLNVLVLSPVRAALWLTPAAVCGAVSVLLVGRSSRPGFRYGRAAMLYALGGAGIACVGSASGGGGLALGAAIAAPALGGAQPTVVAGMLEIARGGRRPASTLGWLFFAEGLGAIAGPAAIGAVIEIGGPRLGMLAVAAAAGLLAAGLWLALLPDRAWPHLRFR